MVTNLLRLLSAINCLEKILDKAQFDTVALLHLNTTTDVADNIYSQVSKNDSLVWLRLNIDNNATLHNRLLQDNVLTKIFSVYVLDDFTDWQYVYEFVMATNYDHRDDHMYVVNRYATEEQLIRVGMTTFLRTFYNCGFLFWNTTGGNSRFEVFTSNGFLKAMYKISTYNDQCNDTTYNKIFSNKLLNLHGNNLTIYGQSDPPKIVRTAALVNGQYEFSLGGHDVLIADTIVKHLNAAAKYKLMMRSMSLIRLDKILETHKSENNIEQKLFNVSEISRYDLEVVEDVDASAYIYQRSGFEINSEKVNFDLHQMLLKRKDLTYLYPHDTDNFVLIVPRRFKSKTDYSHILNSPLIFVWGPITVVATVVRLIFNKIVKTDKKLTDTYFETFGLSIGMSYGAAITSAAENFFLWWYCLGTMLSGTLLSSDMLQGFALHRNVPAINNLKELEMSGMEIHLPNYLDSVKFFFGSVPFNFKLKNTVEFLVAEKMSQRNMSNAYVIREGKFKILFQDTGDWHVLERFGAEYLSYKLRYGSSMECRMNELIQRCVDHGITKYLVAKNKRLLGVNKLKQKDAKVLSIAVKPVSVGDVHEPFVMYALGMTLSLIGFIVEKIVFKKGLRKTKVSPIERTSIHETFDEIT